MNEMGRIKIKKKKGQRGQKRLTKNKTSTYRFLEMDGTPINPKKPIRGKQGKIHKIVPTKDVVDKICLLLRKGHFKKTACAAAGISYSTFKRWMQQGSERAWQSCQTQDDLDKILPYRYAVEQVGLAVAEAEALYLDDIRTAARNGEWRAAAWMMQKRFPKNWGDVKKLQIEANVQHEHNEVKSILENPNTASQLVDLYEDSVKSTDGLKFGEEPEVVEAEVVP